MNRRQFLTLTGTFTGGTLLLPDFLFAFGKQQSLAIGEQCVVFIQLNGGNDGLNTFAPVDNPWYYELRPKIALQQSDVISRFNGMAFHPALSSFAEMQQNGDLSVIQNVGYPEPVRSHFRSQEIWQTSSGANQYLSDGWLGRYLDLQCKEHNPTGGINVDVNDTLALKGQEPNHMTLKNLNKARKINQHDNEDVQLSGNPQLDFVRKLAETVNEGSDVIQKALAKSPPKNINYPKSGLANNLEWIAKLIKGSLNSKVYYTSQGGFDTHQNQLAIHKTKLGELNDAVYSFYCDLKTANLLQNVTVVIFSEFGRRVKDNGSGTDHGTAAPMFIIGGNNTGKIIGNNPNLTDLDNGDLKHQIDFRSVYASLLKNKLDFDYQRIGIENNMLQGLF
ncbi:hypothetical protein FNO01nite_25780 [Flavobacterium noncentrifugens]|uniref:Uncharacterized conserved protein, DUF1501 family n=1 Tax=Flavobacterium noncentrifugens TaxID=1128970 RepID=A0A1G8ZMK3_9FLAO|nr:DUF1501 domain-containing protein [Flavobacterium noncentrifugens]GEP51906.1 hypothetical protein FNO01nite_25780 [Flavobacterium noncentrifugens]SDK16281.1 Uncharacterized conserved protein, DUF1501 family [Flavobacterium noncentrifugens]